MKIELVYVAYNRLEYTRLSLASLLQDPFQDFSIVIWDNGSTDGTREYLSEVQDPRISRKVFPDENAGLHGAFNDLVQTSTADLVGIIPNDFILTPGWMQPLAKAHQDISNLGMVGCWHFFPEDFDYDRAKHKIQEFNGHRILRHPWTGGGAGLVKRETVQEFEPLRTGNTPVLWKAMARKGYINGFYFPLIHVEHMDDPKSKHCLLKDDESLARLKEVTCVLRNNNITTMKERWARREMVLNNLLDDPWDIKYYVGWRKKLRGVKRRVDNLIWRVRSWRNMQ